MAAKQPVAIVFDTFGTVVDWRGSLIAELTEFGRQRGIEARQIGGDVDRAGHWLGLPTP